MRSMQTARKSTGGKAPRRQLVNEDQLAAGRKRSSSAVDTGSAKRPRFNASSKPVKFVVGRSPAVVEYSIHEDLLKQHSAYAVAAMNGQWREADEGIIYLTDDDPAVFEVFANFVYSGKVYSDTAENKSYVTGTTVKTKDDDDSSTHESEAEEEESGHDDAKEWDLLGRCYLFGDRLLSHSFKSAIIDAMTRKVCANEDDGPLELYLLAYNHTAGNNGLKRLAVDIACCASEEVDFKDVTCVDYLRDVALQLRRCKGPPCDRYELCEMGCGYHDHGEDEMCYLEMF